MQVVEADGVGQQLADRAGRLGRDHADAIQATGWDGAFGADPGGGGTRPLVLDTHTVLWWLQEGSPLSATAAAAIAGASDLGISAITWWEIACLVRRGPVESWAARVLALPRVRNLVITPALAMAADRLDMHADPSDRMIVASALGYRAPLLTKDRLINALPGVQTIW